MLVRYIQTTVKSVTNLWDGQKINPAGLNGLDEKEMSSVGWTARQEISCYKIPAGGTSVEERKIRKSKRLARRVAPLSAKFWLNV
jgi:hypothetical protein